MANAAEARRRAKQIYDESLAELRKPGPAPVPVSPVGSYRRPSAPVQTATPDYSAFDAGLAATRERSNQALGRFQQVSNGVIDPVALKYSGEGGPSAGSGAGLVDPVAAKYAPSGLTPLGMGNQKNPAETKPEDNRGILERAGDYIGDWAFQTFGGSGLNLYERGGYFFKPLLYDLPNVVTGGGFGKAAQSTIAPLAAGTSQAFNIGHIAIQDAIEKAITKFENRGLLARANQIDQNIERGAASIDDLEWYRQNRFQIDNARRPIFAVSPGGILGAPGISLTVTDERFPQNKFGSVWQSMVRAYKGEHDPTLPRGGPVAAATGVDNLLTQALGLYSDAWLGGKIAEHTVSPALGAAGRQAGKLTDLANEWAWRKFGGTRAGGKVLNWTQQMANAASDFRKGVALTVEETAGMRGAQTRRARIVNAISSYSRKAAKAGAEIHGDILEGTKWDFPEIRGKLTGNLIDSLVYLYAEAGDEASFFTEPEVLQLAAKRGLDPKIIQRIGDEAKQLNLDAGVEMVGAKLFNADDFAAHAGSYAKRSYWLTQMGQDEAAALAAEMAARGETQSPHFALVQHLATHGGGTGKYSRSTGLNPTGVIRERELMTPQERLAYLPDLSYTRSSAKSVVGQFRAAAQARILEKIADPELGMSLAHKLASDVWNKGDILKQPRFQAELAKIGSTLKKLANEANKPKDGLNARLQELTARVGKSQEQVRHYGQAKVQHQIAEPQPPTPPPPAPEPAPPPGWRQVLNRFQKEGVRPGFKATASERVSQQFAAKNLAEGIRSSRLRIQDLQHSKVMQQYAAELSEYQKSLNKWREQGKVIDQQWETAKAKMDKALIEQDAHIKAMDSHAELTAKVERRKELIEGKRPPELRDAQDALSDALKKVDPDGNFQMTPEVESYWHQKWLDHWTRYSDDIFSQIPPEGLPRVPGGVDPKIAQAMGENNPLIAVALDETLSRAEGAITPDEAMARGWTKWGDDYGPMSQRWASSALKSFIDDALDPNRYLGESKGTLASASKYLGEMFRTLKLYTNPLTHLAIYIQSHFEGMATVWDAGKSFDPKAYKAGMKEIGDYMYRDGPVTPTVKAVLDSGIDMGGGPRTGIDPLITSPQAPQPNRWIGGKIKDLGKQSFVDVQVFPKAGVIKNLIEQGMDPIEAARWAEKGYGGIGIVQGGIETPGLHRLLETLNRSGIAMFTAYPLHSMNRIMQLMVTNPTIALQYPILRHYLMQQTTDEMRELEKQGRIRPTEVPLPFLNNRDGTPAVMDISNIIPHGGAFQGFSPPSVLEGFFRAREEIARGDRPGLNPIDQNTRNQAATIKAHLPGTINRMKQLLDAAAGVEPSDYATQPQTVGQAAMGLLTLPVRDITTPTERRLEPDKEEVIQSRWDFMAQLEDRMNEGLEAGPNFSNHPLLKRLDYVGTTYALAAAESEVRKLTTKGAYPISEKRAKTMIRNQMGWIQALMRHADETEPRMLTLEERARLQSLRGEE